MLKSYTKLLESCFKDMLQKYLYLSECNNLNELERKRKIYHNLGIQLEQGET